MAIIITVSNQKGGVGKTTTSAALATGISSRGRRVLGIDLDPQGNLGFCLGLGSSDMSTVLDALKGKLPIQEAIIRTEYCDILPSDITLSSSGLEQGNSGRKEYLMRDTLMPVMEKYDYIIIDCPPSLNMLTINALTAATSVLVPIQCEYYALEGLSQLIHTIDLVKDRLNNNLEIEGVVFTMYDARTNLSLQVVENVKENLQQNIYKTIIPRNVRLAEAPSYGQPITIYDPRSTGAESYRLLAEEVINREVE